MEFKLGLLFFILLLLHKAQVEALSEPVLLTKDGNTVTRRLGEIASLTCRVDSIGTHKLNWVFVKHSTTLFHGEQRMVDDPRYSLTHPPESNSYTLLINDLRPEDQGTYKCEIDGTKQLATTRLILEGVLDPVVPTVPDKALNHTSCCKQRGVSDACLPACEPRSAPEDIDYVQACAADLSSLIYCGSDGRNHEECCAVSGVPAGCLLFCSNDQEKLAAINSAELVCLNYTTQIISCYEFGGAASPSPPQSLSVVSMSRNDNYTLLVSWKPPKYNPFAVTGYRVHYKKYSESKYRATAILSASFHQFSLKVSVNTRYSIYVVAIGNHGSSQPTDRVDILAESTAVSGHAIDVLFCCQRRKVSSKCQTTLCHPRLWTSFNTTAMIDCYPSLPDVFHCLAGESNHTGCCANNNVPDPCLGMCSGQPPPFSKSLAMCIPKLSTIEACIQSGLSSQPRAPQGLGVTDVTAHTAVISWAAAEVTARSPVDEYFVQLRRGNENASWFTVAEVTGTYFEITNMTETENYAVRLISNTANSSSLPSAVLRFTTYPEVSGTVRPTVAHNFTKCCVDSGMPAVCSAGCQYFENATVYYTLVLGECFNHIGTILTCAADGRDHTSCCRRRNVLEDCYALCAYNTPGGLDFSYLRCIDDTSKIILCYEEGLGNLVRTPEDLMVTSISSHTISIQWKNPETGPKPDYYEVTYSGENSDVAIKETTRRLIYILQNLAPATEYSITVTSIMNDTRSIPTSTVTAFTSELDSSLPFVPTIPDSTSRALWTNRTHCCQSSSISAACQSVCLNQPVADGTDCSAENHNILACAANGKDYSLCCREVGLPEECIPLCSSHTATNFSIKTAGCLADNSLSLITSCFLSDAGLLPTLPENFTARNGYGSQVILEWMPASSCASRSDPCTYDAHYWKTNHTGSSASMTVRNVTSPFSIRALEEDMKYTFTVTARNSRGSGPASPWVSLFFGVLVPAASIAQSPKQDIYEQGMTVYLTCDAYGLREAPRYTWRKRDRVLPTAGRVLTLSNVDKNSEGNYSCTISTRSFSISAASYVNVRFKPEFNYFRTDSVRPYIGEEAVLACWFRGHPNINNPRSVWTKDGKSIPQKSRYSITAKSRFHTGITPFKLKIANVVPSDYGTYKCNVSNQYGYAIAETKLVDPNKAPPPLPATDLQKRNVSNCCRAKGIIEACMPLCTFEVSIEQAVQQPDKYGVCLLFFQELIQCAADGADHSSCCEKEVVPQLCMPFCKGQVPKIQNVFNAPHLQKCVAETYTILNCMDKGYEKIPTAPRNVVCSFIGDKIKVGWELPARHAERVTSYNIYYNFTGNPAYQTLTVTKDVGLSYTLRNMDRNHVYHIWMTAENYNFGRSQISNVVAVSSNISLPIPPVSVSATVSGTTAVIRWNEPPPESASFESFAVYYKPRNAVQEEKKVTTSTSTQLTGLKPNTEYTVYLRSKNIVGEGRKSAPIIFTTGDLEMPASGAGKQDQELSGGQIAGIVLAIIVFIAVVTIIAVLLFQSRLKRQKTTETVAFENPAYSNQQVHIGGLPASTPGDPAMQAEYQPETEGNFDYSRLKEDPVPASGTAKSMSEVDYPHSEYSTTADPSKVILDAENNGAAVSVGANSGDKNESTT